MNEENKNSSITYDENWQNVSVPEIPQFVNQEDESEAESTKEDYERKPPQHRQLLIIIQLIICLLICGFAYGLKCFGGEMYENIRQVYYSELNKELIADGNIEAPDFTKLFSQATGDEV